MAQPTADVLAGRYELGEPLGRGGMADVYRGWDQLLDRAVAVKVLRDVADDATALARFQHEARTLARLFHSGLVMVLDAGITAERPFLVMELVEGPTLAARIGHGPLSLEEAGAIGVQVAEALAYAHSEGVVHRDVKPGNVLLGLDGRVKLADFGIARLVGDAVRYTRPGATIGTAAYLAPEQVQGQDVGLAADIYSLGLVLLEAVTGERTYTGPPVEAALARLATPPPVPASLPPEWRSLLSSMTALEPAHRPSAGTVAAQLRDQPTGPIPVVSSRPAGLAEPGDHPPESPLVSAMPVPDRLETALWSHVARLGRRARGLPTDAVAVVACLAAIVVLIVVAATAGGGSDTPGPPEGAPTELEQPLRDLHNAVEGS